MASITENPTSTGDASTRTNHQNLATSKVLHHVPNSDEPGEDTTGKDGVNAGESSLEAVTDRDYEAYMKANLLIKLPGDVESTTNEEQRVDATESQEKAPRTMEQDRHNGLSGSKNPHEAIDDTVISDNEDSEELADDVRFNAFYRLRTATLRDRVKKAPKRMLQNVAVGRTSC